MRGQPEPNASGGEIYAVSGCIACHGEDRMGTSRGPSLKGLQDHWANQDLAAYFASPSTWVEKDTRLQQLDETFGASMPAFNNLDQAERNRLAAWLMLVDDSNSSQ